MAKKRNSGMSNIRESMESAGTAENPSSMTVAKQLAKRKSLQFAVRTIAFAVVPITLLISAVMFIEATSEEVEVPELNSTSVNDPSGKAPAIVAVEDWLASTPAPLPDGELVSWDGFTESDAPQPYKEGDERPTYVEQVHRFTLKSGDKIYSSQVLVLVDRDEGVKTIDSPTLMPRLAEDLSSWSGEVPWFGYQSNNPRPEVETAVEAWAEAFISGSPRILAQAVGDSKGDRAFVPLTGVESVTASVVTTGSIAPTTEAEEEQWVEPDEMLARVDLLIQWKGEPEPEPGDQASFITFDVLLEDTQTASPTVVSWGGAGSGPSLTPYSVGLLGVTLTEPTGADGEEITEDDEDDNAEDTE